MKKPASSGAFRDQRGASAAEYALLVSLIAVIILGAVTLFGANVAGLFDRSCDKVSGATRGSSC